MNPKPLADCQWTVKLVNGNGADVAESTEVFAGSGLARARATVKPSTATVLDRHHYKRNSTYAEVQYTSSVFYSTTLHMLNIVSKKNTKPA